MALTVGDHPTVPYWRLSGFYLLYFAITGAFIPYWSLYLHQLGYTPVAIGALMALPMATKIIAPFLWGWLADHSGQRIRVIRLGAGLAAAIFAGIFFAHGTLWLGLVILGFSFFWNAILPQFEVVTLVYLKENDHRYSWIRLWGSIGFILSVTGLGYVFGRLSIDWLLPVLGGLFTGLWIMSLFVPAEERVAVYLVQHGVSLWRALRQPGVLALLATCLLIQASHGPYYAFFTLFLQEHGYSSALTGELWALGVLAEIFIFLFMPHWLPRFGARKLLIFALAATVVRWLLLALFVTDLPVLIFSQTLHAASYGVYHVAAIYLIYRYFPGHLQGRGQALYASVSFGAGGALGALASGYVWSALFPGAAFLMGAALAAAGGVVAYFGLPETPTRAA